MVQEVTYVFHLPQYGVVPSQANHLRLKPVYTLYMFIHIMKQSGALKLNQSPSPQATALTFNLVSLAAESISSSHPIACSGQLKTSKFIVSGVSSGVPCSFSSSTTNYNLRHNYVRKVLTLAIWPHSAWAPALPVEPILFELVHVAPPFGRLAPLKNFVGMAWCTHHISSYMLLRHRSNNTFFGFVWGASNY